MELEIYIKQFIQHVKKELAQSEQGFFLYTERVINSDDVS